MKLNDDEIYIVYKRMKKKEERKMSERLQFNVQLPLLLCINRFN